MYIETGARKTLTDLEWNGVKESIWMISQSDVREKNISYIMKTSKHIKTCVFSILSPFFVN